MRSNDEYSTDTSEGNRKGNIFFRKQTAVRSLVENECPIPKAETNKEI